MLNAYLNYPNSRVTIHRDPACGMIQPTAKANQRRIRIEPSTVVAELKRFREREFRFQSTSELNDMWLEIDFGDLEFETLVADYIRRVLGQRYKRFADAETTVHC